MIDRAEIQNWARRFGVSPEQIERDHLVSHALWAIAESTLNESLVFYGGTALCRTVLPGWRVSEDIDLWGRRVGETLAEIRELLLGSLEREHPVADAELAGGGKLQLRTEAGVELQVQVVDYGTRYERCIPTEVLPVELRYGDLPDSVDMRVPTGHGFAAMKHLALVDREAPRDLIDCHGLGRRGFLSPEADAIVQCLRGSPIRPFEVGRTLRPAGVSWDADLSRQMSEVPDVQEVGREVQSCWARSLGWEDGSEWN